MKVQTYTEMECLGLVPYVNFPSQLRQANAAISHLFAAGVSSQNLQIISDSAGANLVIQVLSHALHPINSIPRSPLTPMLEGTMPPIRGIYMLSPWTFHGMRYGNVVHSNCFDENDANDFASASMLRYWASSVFPHISREQQPYIEAAVAPSDWFDDVHLLVDRILVTAAQYECLRDHIVEFCHTQLASVESLKLVLVEGAVHGDPILTAGTPEGKGTKQKIVAWLKEGFDI